jgi:hypothetical protein
MAPVNDGIHSSEEDLTGNMSGLEDEEEASVEDSITKKANLIKIENVSAPKTRKFKILEENKVNLSPRNGLLTDTTYSYVMDS